MSRPGHNTILIEYVAVALPFRDRVDAHDEGRVYEKFHRSLHSFFAQLKKIV